MDTRKGEGNQPSLSQCIPPHGTGTAGIGGTATRDLSSEQRPSLQRTSPVEQILGPRSTRILETQHSTEVVNRLGDLQRARSMPDIQNSRQLNSSWVAAPGGNSGEFDQRLHTHQQEAGVCHDQISRRSVGQIYERFQLSQQHSIQENTSAGLQALEGIHGRSSAQPANARSYWTPARVGGSSSQASLADATADESMGFRGKAEGAGGAAEPEDNLLGRRAVGRPRASFAPRRRSQGRSSGRTRRNES